MTSALLLGGEGSPPGCGYGARAQGLVLLADGSLVQAVTVALTSFRYAGPPRCPTHGGNVLPALWWEVTPCWSM